MVKPTDTELKIPGGLTHTFIQCDTCLPDEDYNRLRQHELSEKETYILQGQLSDSVSGVMERGAVATNKTTKQAENRQAKERKTAQIIELVEQIRADIEQMKARIKALEETFQKRDGDAWREKLALNILDADNIPQQESGETIHDYRKRLEQHLINEMLNPDGTIKGKYKNDPKYSDYAEWAQKQYHLNSAKAAVAELEDDNTSPQRQEQILDEMKERGRSEEMMLADRYIDDKNIQASIRNTRDNARDTILQDDKSTARNDFMNLRS
ncbi:MAG: hypothetical protein H6937_02590 [Burkholderiales bacterium]|nr:hypothetical protein [Burkholderiales bacterium]